MSVFHNLGGGSSASKKDIVDALQYSGLGIIEKNTWDEICDTLAAHFPQMFLDTSSEWDVDTLSPFSQCSRDNEIITFSSSYADGHTAFCETSNIPCESCNAMRISGKASCTSGSSTNNATIRISSADDELYFGTITNGGELEFEIDVPISQYLKIETYGVYQDTSVEFSIALFNEKATLMVEMLSSILNTYLTNKALMTLNMSIEELSFLLDSMTNGKNRTYQFAYCDKIEAVPNMDFSSYTSFAGTFFGCKALKSVPNIDTSKGTEFSNMFNTCSSLTTIEGINIEKATDVKNMFSKCGALKHIKFNGKIKITGLDLSATDLTRETLLHIIEDALEDYAGTTSHNLVLGASNLAKLETHEKSKAQLKGWSLS